MKRIIWLPMAIENLIAIEDHIAEDSIQTALEVSARIEVSTDKLLDHPKIGKPGRVKETRELVVTGLPYIAVYRLKGNLIQIIRILHGAQEWPPQEKNIIIKGRT